MNISRLAKTAGYLTLFAAATAQAVTFTYTGLDGANDWSSGTDWDATPVSASDTALDFTGALALGAVLTSNNDIADPFTLNRLDLNYSGAVNSGSPRPTFEMSGGTLNFVADGGTNPVLDQRDISGVDPSYTINNNITASDPLTIFADRLTYTGILNVSSDLTVTGNPAGNFTLNLLPGGGVGGDLTIITNGTSGGNRSVVLGADNQLGGSVTVIADSEGGHVSTFSLNGFNQTINALTATYRNNMQNESDKQLVNNGAATDSTLTLGANDTTSGFLGKITDGGGGGALHITKIGTGTQTFSAPSDYTGATDVQAGGITVDFTQMATSQSSTPADYFSPDSDLTLAGDTSFNIVGNSDGAAYFEAGASTNLYADFVTLADTTGLVVGQELIIEGVGSRFITNIEGNKVSTNNRTGGGARDVTVVATPGSTTTQNIKSITFAGADGENTTIDFGMSENVMLMIGAAPVQLSDGSTVTLANWSGSFSGGSGDQWIFSGEPVDFTSVFDQSEIIFDGIGAGYNIIDGSGIYEVVAVPEPGTYALIVACGALLIAIRRRQRS